MSKIRSYKYVKCHFVGLTADKSTYFSQDRIDVYYGFTRNLLQSENILGKYLSEKENERKLKFLSPDDCKTYVISHGIMRLILSFHINSDPEDLSYYYEINNKPGIPKNPVFFNLTHTKNAFAIAVTRNHYVGIDLEDISTGIEIKAIARNYFGPKEREYIFYTEKGAFERFFLIWTRKEALLKALGTGIVDNLAEISLCDEENEIDPLIFNNHSNCLISNPEHFLYTKRILNSYLSVASPQPSEVRYQMVNNKSISKFLNK